MSGEHVNLMPDDLRRIVAARARRRNALRWGAALGAAATLWIGAAVLQMRHLDRQIEALEHAAGPTRKLAAERDRLARASRALRYEVAALDAMRGPMCPAEVLAVLSRLMPEDAVASKVVIAFPPLPDVDDAGRGRAHRAGRGGAHIHIQLEGLAVTDAAMPMLLDRLRRSGVFSEVRLVSNREEHSNQSGQVFQLSMSIPLTEEPVEPDAGGVSS